MQCRSPPTGSAASRKEEGSSKKASGALPLARATTRKSPCGARASKRIPAAKDVGPSFGASLALATPGLSRRSGKAEAFPVQLIFNGSPVERRKMQVPGHTLRILHTDRI